MSTLLEKPEDIPQKNFNLFEGFKLSKGVRNNENVEDVLSQVNQKIKPKLELSKLEEISTYLAQRACSIAQHKPALVEDLHEENPGGFESSHLGAVSGFSLEDPFNPNSRIILMGVWDKENCNPRMRPENQEYSESEKEVLFALRNIIQMLECNQYSLSIVRNDLGKNTVQLATQLPEIIEKMEEADQALADTIDSFASSLKKIAE